MQLSKIFSSVALVALVMGCASKNSNTGTVTDDAGEEDTAPVEDTAPWLTYPDGPYGVSEKGQTFPPLVLQGYHDAKGEFTTLSMIDYYDPTGERGIYAILYVVSAEWCNPCKEEAKMLPGFYDSIYKPRGARFIESMFQNASGKPADQATLDRWIKATGINFDIVADPEEQAAPKTASIPRNYIINPRDMKIYRVNTGVNPDATSVPGLKPLLDALGAPPAPGSTTTDAGTGG